LTDKASLELTASWIHAGKIQMIDEENKSVECELTDAHKHAIVKEFNASTHFSAEQKKDLLDKAFSADTSDAGK
jgi:hypothetical protein